jgi:hypothetical protein
MDRLWTARQFWCELQHWVAFGNGPGGEVRSDLAVKASHTAAAAMVWASEKASSAAVSHGCPAAASRAHSRRTLPAPHSPSESPQQANGRRARAAPVVEAVPKQVDGHVRGHVWCSPVGIVAHRRAPPQRLRAQVRLMLSTAMLLYALG